MKVPESPYYVSYGECLQLMYGAYSDEHVAGTVVMQWTGDLSTLVPLFVKEKFGQDPEFIHFYGDDFVTWLIARNYAIPLKLREIDLGYSSDLCDWEEDDFERIEDEQ